MIRVQGLSKSFGKTKAVTDLSLSVESGEILGLLGPNGAGKTTTMRCICGIIRPSTGSILIDGIDLLDEPVRAKGRLAFVPADPQLFDYLTVGEHLGFFSRLHAAQDPSTRSERLSRQKELGQTLLEEFDLAGRADSLPGALSRGMKQKLMIACALIHEPRVLIFDEPFTGLDPHAIRKVRQIIQAHIGKGASVIISSHLLGMVEDMIDRALIIHHGSKLAEGRLEELRSKLTQGNENADLEEIFIQLTSPGTAT